MLIDRTQEVTDKLLKWIEDNHLPEWVESEMKESLEYMMELHRQKMAGKASVRL